MNNFTSVSSIDTTTIEWQFAKEGKMNKLAFFIANGEVTVEELANAKDLIERAELVSKGINACKTSIMFPIEVNEVSCYSYTDSAGEYHSWGTCTNCGMFTCYCNWGGDHEIGRVDLTNFEQVFMAFENSEFAHDLKRFLQQQIKKVAN